MKKNIKILMKYFGKHYTLKNKTDQYQYVADELGVTTRTVWNALKGKTKNPVLEKLAQKVVDSLRAQGLIT